MDPRDLDRGGRKSVRVQKGNLRDPGGDGKVLCLDSISVNIVVVISY